MNWEVQDNIQKELQRRKRAIKIKSIRDRGNSDEVLIYIH